MAYNLMPPLLRRWLAGVLAVLLGLGPLATPVFAVPPFIPNGGAIPLADEPLNVKSSAKPNIILTVDDSTSMLYDFLPDFVAGKYCRDGTGGMNAPCGFTAAPINVGSGGKYISPQYLWEQVNMPYPTYGNGGGLYDASGPGVGCNLLSIPPTCSAGIAPGPLPGIAIYPAASGSPSGGKPYEYWLLWPAPGHNSAMNSLYYDPRLTYDPPVDSAGVSFAQMDAGGTSSWTSVPADVWAPTITYVDLTATVTVGQWCNSDWTQGNDDSGNAFVTNPSYCRTNGLVSGVSSPIATGDYMYPWLPVNIFTGAPDYNFYESKVDMSTVNIASFPPVNATVRPAWATAQNPKYFYENENVLWCDISSPDWPQTGPTQPQTCQNYTSTQTCIPNPTQPTCTGGVSGVCGGAVGAGTCNTTTSGQCSGYVANGQCSGYAANGQCTGWAANGKCSGFFANGKCTGYIPGTCSATANGTCTGFVLGVCAGYSAGVCSGALAAACANPPTCSGAGPATCAGNQHEACVAGTAAACNGITGQTCNGTPIACNPVAQICNGAGAQTCQNIVAIPPPPSSCTSAWVPAGCNLNPDPEGTCNYVTTCPPPTYQGNCSITHAVCASDADCPFVNGTCSVQTSRSCASNADCTGLNYCQGTSNSCATSANCGVSGGTCNVSGGPCTFNTDCPMEGTCNYKNTGGVNNGPCQSAANCQAFPNHCQVTTATLCNPVGANNASCPLIPNSGACNYKNNSGTNFGPCNVNTDCQGKPNVCNNPVNQACASVATCTQGTCNYQNQGGVANGPCAVLADCKSRPNTCQNAGATFGNNCATAAACTDNGSCTAGLVGNTCTANGNNAACNKAGTCTTGNVGAACTCAATGNCVTAGCALITGVCTAGINIGSPCTNATPCTQPGACSTGNVGAVCNSNSSTDVACKKSGACTTGNIGAVCNSSSSTDVACAKTGACSTGNVGAPCTTNSATDVACKKAGACTTGNVGAVCNSNSATDPSCAKSGACTTGNVGAVCNSNSATDPACAKTTGVCSNAPTTVCTSNANCPAIPGTCSAGKPSSTACLVNSDCDIANVCGSSQNNGTTCNPANIPTTTGGACQPLKGSCSDNHPAGAQVCSTAADCAQSGVCKTASGGGTMNKCYSNADCSNSPGPLDPANARCDSTGVSNNPATTLLADANGAGKACRRNNHAYAGLAAAPYNFPSGKFTTPVTGEIVAGQGCEATNRYANVPRHYWKTSIEWCDKKIATAGNEWLGYGTNVGGTCQAGKDATHIYPRFFQFGAASYVNNDVDVGGTAAFQRVDMDITQRATATYTHNWIDVVGQPQTITRSFDAEMTNYANWFTYYRTRILAVKTVTSLSFSALDDQYRVGFETLSNGQLFLSNGAALSATVDPAQYVDIQDFDAVVQKPKWFAQLFNIQIPLGLETPTLEAMMRVGEYFKNGASSYLSGATDPITLSCQKNWHMLFTDGFTNQAGLPATTVADVDDTVLSLPQPVAGLTVGQPWPNPFREDPTAGAANAASDYAMHYWVTDLRPGAGPTQVDNVPTTAKDPASWQHLNFAAMSLGTQGKLPVANQSLTENQLASGALQWPQPIPNVWKPDNSGVDDLWHAAINGRGRFVNAGSADELKLGMGQILQDITNQAGSRAGVGLASSSISLTNHAVYRVTFQPGWAGTITKIDIDPVSGLELGPIWEASQQLHNQLTILPPPNDTPWFTKRSIFTTDSDAGGNPRNGVPFLWGSLSAAQQDSLAPGLPVVGQAVLEFLRGNPTNEGVSLGQLRVRATASFGENFLGDIVDSQAVFIGAPNAPYLGSNDPGYSAWAAGLSSRVARIYAGANDGMLHAFIDGTPPEDVPTLMGNEAWAYVPHDMYRPDATGIGALAYQDGALPPFRHHFYVDSTPRIIDANFGGGPGDWHTLLAGGLGKGGQSYYALDVTNPSSVTSDATAAAQYLWTFTDPEMGYSYARPMIAKTRAFGGRWLVIVSSGYDNTTGPNPGEGKVFFLDAATGTKLFTMSTGVGNAGNPSGMTHIAGYTQDFHNQLVEQIYGGDLYGNFWRFDVSDANEGNWQVQQLAYFTDPINGNPQPVTTPPQIEIDIANGVDRWVFIGTGRLLDETDLTNATISNQIQTFYAIRDGTTTTPNPIGAVLQRSDFVLLADRVNGLAGKPQNGWYDDLPAGERIVTPVQAALSVVAYVGTSPQDNPCLTGQPATLYVREYSLGETLLSDAAGNPTAGIGEVQGAVGLDITIFTDSSGPSSASGVDIRVAVTAGTTGDVVFQHIKPPLPLSQHRMSWRLLGQ
jgi:type IV pilus assembly protein PilY1